MTTPLEGITVLDLTRGLAGGITTMVLGDFGAEVIKVEPPAGDPFRAVPASLLWDRGKKSVVLDLHAADGPAQLRRLATTADVLVESLRPGVLDHLGLSYDALREANPRLVYCSLTGFGPKGPYARYKGYEGAVMAKAGRFTAFAGQKQRPGPIFGVVNVASHGASMAAIRGVVAALLVRDRTGRGQHVRTSLLQGLTTYDLGNWIQWQLLIKDPERFPADPGGNARRGPATGIVAGRTKDGRWIQMANLLPHLLKEALRSMGLSYVLEDPRFKTAPALTDENREALRIIMMKKFQERTLDEWMEYFMKEATDVAAEPFMTTEEGMSHPQVLHNGHIQQVMDPRVGPMRQLGVLAHLGATPGSVKGPAPLVGQNTAEVMARVPAGTTAARDVSLRKPLPKHPLEGVVVLDLGQVIAGPQGASLLAEMGARVIHLEQHQGDYMRGIQQGAGAMRTLAGTEGVSIDLKTPEGERILQQLVEKSDVLIHNMRPGAPERLGIGYEQLRLRCPKLVYLYVAGYGSTGPSSHRTAMHPIPGAVMGGALAQFGRPGLPSPGQPLSWEETWEVARQLGKANESNPDFTTAMSVATSAVLALYARQRFGTGQYVEVTMLQANAYANAIDCFSYQGKPPRSLLDPAGYGLHALYRLYPAQDGWVFLACPFEEEWRALCTALGKRHLLDDPRFATGQARKVHDDALAAELAALFLTRAAGAWEEALTAADVCCVQVEERGPYHFFNDDPHVQENGFTTEVETPRFGRFWRYSPLLDFSLTPGIAGPGPARGQHTRSILKELGYSEADIVDLRTRKVVDWEELKPR